jgi:hypothetical protein
MNGAGRKRKNKDLRASLANPCFFNLSSCQERQMVTQNFNQGDMEKVTELPIPGISRGRQGDRACLRTEAGNALRLYPDRQLRILNLVAQGDQVVLEQIWQGTAAAAVEPLRPGDRVRFRVVSFFTLRDGLIIKQTDYVIPLPGENQSDIGGTSSVDQ